MKTHMKIYSLFIVAFCSILFTNCQKEAAGINTTLNQDIKLSNTTVSAITQIRATITATIVSNGGNAITERGVCYDTVPNPTVSSTKKTNDTTTVDSFSVRITQLKPNKTYYARAYASNSKGTGYGEEVTFTTHEIKIGDLFEGGTVFYIDATGRHGLVAAREGEDYAAVWGCMGVSAPGTATGIGTGVANTSAIMKVCNTAGIAARWTNQLNKDSFGDWYLPSKDELTEMFAHKDVVVLNGATRWSSSEIDANTAWALSFDQSGKPVPVPQDKTAVLGVRAIRSFSF